MLPLPLLISPKPPPPMKRKGYVASQQWRRAEPGAGRHGVLGVPWLALHTLLGPDSCCRPGVLQMANLCFILPAPGKLWVSTMSAIQSPGLWRIACSAVPKTGRLCVNSASIVLSWEKPQEHQGDLALSDHTAPLSSRGPAQSRLLSEFQMAGWSAGLPLSLPPTACAPTPPHRTLLPLPQPAPRRESRMTSPVSPAFSLSFTISWDQKRLSSPTSLSGLHFLYLKLWPDPLNLSIGTLEEPMKKFR